MVLSTPARPAGARLVALGHYQPEKVVTNADIIARGVDTDDEWIKSRVGIAERRISEHESVVDMGEQAAARAIASSGLTPADIDLVILATCTQQYPIPNGAAELASRLGIDAPGAYDLNAACAGFVYALASAAQAISSGQSRAALVVGAERLSSFTDPNDRSTAIIFADGAGAAVIAADSEPAIGPVVWGSDGGHSTAIEVTEESGGTLRQDGQAVYRWATSTMPGVAERACAAAGIATSDLVAFVPHQANLRIIDLVAKRLGAENATVARDIVNSGNTSSASIPIAMSKMVERGEIPSGSPVLLVGFGAGLTYAAQVVLSP